MFKTDCNGKIIIYYSPSPLQEFVSVTQIQTKAGDLS